MNKAINTASLLSFFMEQQQGVELPPSDGSTQGTDAGKVPAVDKAQPDAGKSTPPENPGPGSDQPPAPGGDQNKEEDAPPADPLSADVQAYVEILRKSPADKEVLREALSAMLPKAEGAAHRTFVLENLSAITMLDETVVTDAQKKIRRGKADEKTPQDLVASMEEVISSVKEFGEAVQRISALGSNRGAAWRQLVAVLCGGAIVPGPLGGEVHVPIGGKKKGNILVVRPKAYLGWGAVDLGRVAITSESPAEYLGGEEQAKLTSGAPEMKRVLRNAMVIEAIADQLGGGVFAILVVSQEGSWQTAYFDSDLFKEAYESGTAVVIEPYPQPGGSLAFDQDGNTVNIAAWGIALVDKSSGIIDNDTGEKRYSAVQVAESTGERLVYTGDNQQLSSLGANVYDHQWVSGDPEQLEKVRSSVPSARETIMGARP